MRGQISRELVYWILGIAIAGLLLYVFVFSSGNLLGGFFDMPLFQNTGQTGQ